MLNALSLIFHIIIGIGLCTAGVGINTWQMWVIWACILGINIVRSIQAYMLY